MKKIILFLLHSYSVILFAYDISWETNDVIRKVKTFYPNEILVEPDIVNLNSASKDELTKLKGIGPKKAAAIIAYRRRHGAFKNIDDLLKIKGFTRKTLAQVIEKNKEIISITPPK